MRVCMHAGRGSESLRERGPTVARQHCDLPAPAHASLPGEHVNSGGDILPNSWSCCAPEGLTSAATLGPVPQDITTAHRWGERPEAASKNTEKVFHRVFATVLVQDVFEDMSYCIREIL
jgi:hypothetical protein